MKKITIVFVLAFVVVLNFGLVVIQAGAEDMNFKLVSMFDKIEVVKVTETEGVMLGVMDRKATRYSGAHFLIGLKIDRCSTQT